MIASTIIRFNLIPSVKCVSFFLHTCCRQQTRLLLFNKSLLGSNSINYSVDAQKESSISSPSNKAKPGKAQPVRSAPKAKDERQLCNVTAISTAEEYSLSDFYSTLMRKPDYLEVHLCEDLENGVIALKFRQNDDKSIAYIFKEGSSVFWNVSQTEREKLLSLLKPFEYKPYPQNFILDEEETVNYTNTDGKSKLDRGIFYVNHSENPPLSQYSFSNALALSVKLSIWEASLKAYIDSINFVSEDISEGKKITLTRDQVFRKTGQLFSLRHRINLSSDLLDTPDFYWDRQELEKFFNQTCLFLNTSKRTKVMNEKLNHCCELMSLLEGHLNDKHHVRLEWMIIILIMVEVVFEIIHYVERLGGPEE